MHVPNTQTRVEARTDEAINRRIRRETERRVASYAGRTHRAIDRRLHALEREWDIERTLETNAALVSLLGLGLGRLVDRRFYLLPGVVAAFLLQHAVQGWCPPLPVFRRFGFRTTREINVERYALKALRGDFASLPTASPTNKTNSAKRLISAMGR